jgi:subtilisin-like proprotein convertase family protein
LRRRLCVASLALLALLALAAAPASAKTKSFSSGAIGLRIPPSATVERTMRVGLAGPVSFVSAAVRIAHPHTGDLTLSLVSPRGTVVPLAVRRGTGADFGEGAGCRGALTVFYGDSRPGKDNPIGKGEAPFTDSPYAADGRLSRLSGEEARGTWTLRVTNAGSAAGRLRCFDLDVSVAVPETRRASRDGISVAVSSVERNYAHDRLRVQVVRRGRTVIDGPVAKLGCAECDSFTPTSVTVRDLDGGEPEVIVDLYSGGAHCCSITLILGWDARRARYRVKLSDWGNYGYRIVDLDRDGLPEFSAYDESFVYTFTSYAESAAPIQVWQYRNGLFIDVTRDFPAAIAADARSLLRTYDRYRGKKDSDVRAFAAAYAADLYQLGRANDAERFLATAAKRGELHGIDGLRGLAFVADLKRFLRQSGYLEP